MLGRRAAGAGLEQAAAGHQRDDREHLRARAELEDREQVGEVVAQTLPVTEIVSLPRRARSSVNRAASARQISISRPSVSSARAGADLAQQLRVVRAGLVEPEDGRRAGGAGAARPPARPSRGSARPSPGTCARCRPAATSCSISVGRRRRRRGRVPGAGISKVLSCEPYSSAAWAISPTFGVVPIVAGSNAPCAGSRRPSRRTAARSAWSGITNFVSCCSPWAFHIWPEARIAAGIEASMITSLGTCRLVIPRSESTIASAGPSA